LPLFRLVPFGSFTHTHTHTTSLWLVTAAFYVYMLRLTSAGLVCSLPLCLSVRGSIIVILASVVWRRRFRYGFCVHETPLRFTVRTRVSRSRVRLRFPSWTRSPSHTAVGRVVRLRMVLAACALAGSHAHALLFTVATSPHGSNNTGSLVRAFVRHGSTRLRARFGARLHPRNFAFTVWIFVPVYVCGQFLWFARTFGFFAFGLHLRLLFAHFRFAPRAPPFLFVWLVRYLSRAFTFVTLPLRYTVSPVHAFASRFTWLRFSVLRVYPINVQLRSRADLAFALTVGSRFSRTPYTAALVTGSFFYIFLVWFPVQLLWFAAISLWFACVLSPGWFTRSVRLHYVSRCRCYTLAFTHCTRSFTSVTGSLLGCGCSFGSFTTVWYTRSFTTPRTLFTRCGLVALPHDTPLSFCVALPARWFTVLVGYVRCAYTFVLFVSFFARFWFCRARFISLWLRLNVFCHTRFTVRRLFVLARLPHSLHLAHCCLHTCGLPPHLFTHIRIPAFTRFLSCVGFSHARFRTLQRSDRGFHVLRYHIAFTCHFLHPHLHATRYLFHFTVQFTRCRSRLPYVLHVPPFRTHLAVVGGLTRSRAVTSRFTRLYASFACGSPPFFLHSRRTCVCYTHHTRTFHHALVALRFLAHTHFGCLLRTRGLGSGCVRSRVHIRYGWFHRLRLLYTFVSVTAHTFTLPAHVYVYYIFRTHHLRSHWFTAHFGCYAFYRLHTSPFRSLSHVHYSWVRYAVYARFAHSHGSLTRLVLRLHTWFRYVPFAPGSARPVHDLASFRCVTHYTLPADHCPTHFSHTCFFFHSSFVCIVCLHISSFSAVCVMVSLRFAFTLSTFTFTLVWTLIFLTGLCALVRFFARCVCTRGLHVGIF